jgi:hypothetical protein
MLFSFAMLLTKMFFDALMAPTFVLIRMRRSSVM